MNPAAASAGLGSVAEAWKAIGPETVPVYGPPASGLGATLATDTVALETARAPVAPSIAVRVAVYVPPSR